MARPWARLFTADTPPVSAIRRRHLRAVASRAPWEQAPRWGPLYATLMIIAIVSFAAEVMASTVGWRRLVEVLTAVAALGSMALWLKLNRLRLACQDPRAGNPRPRRVIHGQVPRPLHPSSLPRFRAR